MKLKNIFRKWDGMLPLTYQGTYQPAAQKYKASSVKSREGLKLDFAPMDA